MTIAINWLSDPPANPQIGDCVVNHTTSQGFIWTGNEWALYTYILPRDLAPTPEQLKKYPSLRQAWEEYLVVKRLLGI